jgi:hypothetical protein
MLDIETGYLVTRVLVMTGLVLTTVAFATTAVQARGPVSRIFSTGCTALCAMLTYIMLTILVM